VGTPGNFPAADAKSTTIGYNSKRSAFSKGSAIKSRVFSIIRDVNETLSLTNEPGQLVNMSLDTLAQVLGVECCWIQTIDGRLARLAAERGLTPEMRSELAAMDMGHSFAEKIIGLGHRIVIPELAADGAYGLASFRAAGFRWLVAVPLMTYRVHGILGIASRSRKLLRKETPELTMVIGGLIGTALNKSNLFQKSTRKEKPGPRRSEAAQKPAQPAEGSPEAGLPAVPAPDAPPGKNGSGAADGHFHAHARRMKKFRGSHQPD
jgi:transcriptional regulator with GAF, ATPase, and Fis domain